MTTLKRLRKQKWTIRSDGQEVKLPQLNGTNNSSRLHGIPSIVFSCECNFVKLRCRVLDEPSGFLQSQHVHRLHRISNDVQRFRNRIVLHLTQLLPPLVLLVADYVRGFSEESLPFILQLMSLTKTQHEEYLKTRQCSSRRFPEDKFVEKQQLNVILPSESKKDANVRLYRHDACLDYWKCNDVHYEIDDLQFLTEWNFFLMQCHDLSSDYIEDMNDVANLVFTSFVVECHLDAVVDEWSKYVTAINLHLFLSEEYDFVAVTKWTEHGHPGLTVLFQLQHYLLFPDSFRSKEPKKTMLYVLKAILRHIIFCFNGMFTEHGLGFFISNMFARLTDLPLFDVRQIPQSTKFSTGGWQTSLIEVFSFINCTKYDMHAFFRKFSRSQKMENHRLILHQRLQKPSIRVADKLTCRKYMPIDCELFAHCACPFHNRQESALLRLYQ